MRQWFFVLVFCCFFLSMPPSCQFGGGRKERKKNLFGGMDRRTKMRMKSYLVNGYHLYEKHCAACHQSSGRGLEQLYPPLIGSDYLLNNPQGTACMIRFGTSKNKAAHRGHRYALMPGNEQLRRIEIAEILTYISNAWENQEGFFPVKEVDKYLEDCKVLSPSATERPEDA